MARYEVEISRTAEKQLRALPRADQERVARRMYGLADDPFPRGTRKLAGLDDVFRVRVGRYRILYSVEDTALIIVVLKVRPPPGHLQLVRRFRPPYRAPSCWFRPVGIDSRLRAPRWRVLSGGRLRVYDQGSSSPL